MKTAKDIEYRVMPYGYIATIPAGTPVIPADNLPDAGSYWAEPWPGMDEKAEGWMNGYGFLIEADEVTGDD